MSYKLFLDDVRSVRAAIPIMESRGIRTQVYLEDGWLIARSYQDFVDLVTEHGIPDMISYDHDLADIHYDSRTWKETFKYDEETGLDCAKWMVEYCREKGVKHPPYLVHSMNPVGASNIKNYLR